ncbi:MAG: Gfo/Idh/MocA family oxidoreductase [Planctomycetota bacterium]
MTIRTAVVGVGSFGRHHVRILSGLPGVDLVAAVDPRVDERRANVERFDVPLLSHVDELPDDLDAAIVAVPTSSHREVAEPLLARGVSVLVEKPLASSVPDASALVRAAEDSGAVLAVGHVERFDPAIDDVARRIPDPRRIESRRVAPWSPRVRDIGVVFDLLIHDVDVCLALVPSDISDVSARGRSVVTDHEDEVRARLQFENGCVAELTASRVVPETERSLSVRGGNGTTVAVEFDRGGDKLTSELTDFLRAVETGSRPRVPGEDGLRAVAAAARVLAALA